MTLQRPSFDFFTSLKNNLELLPKGRKVDFGLNICKRLLPDYIIFNQKYNWGNSETLNRAIESIDGRIKTDLNKESIYKLIAKVNLLVPDTDDFGEVEGSYALNASVSVVELLEYLIDEDKEHIINISRNILDTIDFKIREKEPTLTSQKLEEHYELVQEMYYQLEITK